MCSQNNLQEETDKLTVSTVELLAARKELLQSTRFKIGILSSGILENPEQKIGNLKLLLDMMDEKSFEIYITVRKLAMVSLLEVFKDILPSYSIIQISQEGVKCTQITFKDTTTHEKSHMFAIQSIIIFHEFCLI